MTAPVWPEQITVGCFTFALVEYYDDSWGWAIVKDYEDPQYYDCVICPFHQYKFPDRSFIEAVLKMLSESDENRFVC